MAIITVRRKLLHKPKKRSKRKPALLRAASRKVELRALIREAAKAGVAEGIEHCRNFWGISDGYKRYIDYQVKSRAEELLAAVKTALREGRTSRRKK